jgi:molybdate transport system substrate-binding protein
MHALAKGLGLHCGCLAAALLVALPAGHAVADEALVAVAANFKDVMEVLEERFEQQSGHELEISIGSTGQFYSQVVQGAPFDVFLAADQERPARLEREHRAVPGSRFTYAVGRLALWSPDPGRIGDDGAATLEQGDFRRLAIANPDLAPYGAAVIEVLEALGLEERLRPKIVMGEDIGQAFSLVATGNVELGFVALSYVLAPQNEQPGSRWEIPAELHSPIRQDAVLLSHGAGNAAARALLEFLRSEDTRREIERWGYGTE